MKILSEYLLVGTVISIIYMIWLLKKDGLLDKYKNDLISMCGDDMDDDTATKLIVIYTACVSYFLWPIAAWDIICSVLNKYSNK